MPYSASSVSPRGSHNLTVKSAAEIWGVVKSHKKCLPYVLNEKRNDKNESIEAAVKRFHKTIEVNPLGVSLQPGFDVLVEMAGVI